MVLEQLEGLPLSTIKKQQYSMVAKDIVLFGAMSILYIDALVDSQLPSTSFLLVEKDPHFLCAALHLVDFQGLISKLKSLNVGFNLIFEPSIKILVIAFKIIMEQKIHWQFLV